MISSFERKFVSSGSENDTFLIDIIYLTKKDEKEAKRMKSRLDKKGGEKNP